MSDEMQENRSNYPDWDWDNRCRKGGMRLTILDEANIDLSRLASELDDLIIEGRDTSAMRILRSSVKQRMADGYTHERRVEFILLVGLDTVGSAFWTANAPQRMHEENEAAKPRETMLPPTPKVRLNGSNPYRQNLSQV